MQRYEYRVVEVREGLIGGKMSGDKVEKVLNEHAREGWQLKALTLRHGEGPHRPRWHRRAARHLRAPGHLRRAYGSSASRAL